MPLYRKQIGIAIRRFHRLNQSILRMSAYLQPMPDTPDALVMQAVNTKAPLNNFAEARLTIRHRDAVRQVRAVRRLAMLDLECGIAFEILVKRAAELYVHHLRAAADCENRKVALPRPVSIGELELI